MLTFDKMVQKCNIGGKNSLPLCTFCFKFRGTPAASGGNRPNHQQHKNKEKEKKRKQLDEVVQKGIREVGTFKINDNWYVMQNHYVSSSGNYVLTAHNKTTPCMRIGSTRISATTMDPSLIMARHMNSPSSIIDGSTMHEVLPYFFHKQSWGNTDINNRNQLLNHIRDMP